MNDVVGLDVSFSAIIGSGLKEIKSSSRGFSRFEKNINVWLLFSGFLAHHLNGHQNLIILVI